MIAPGKYGGTHPFRPKTYNVKGKYLGRRTNPAILIHGKSGPFTRQKVTVNRGIPVAAGGAVLTGAAAYGGYKLYQHHKANSVHSGANARGQVAGVKRGSRVGKKSNNPFYTRKVKGKTQRVRKGKR